mgnify:CR=1 FL=1
MMAPLRAAARQAARAAGARRDFQTQKSYHGAGQASGADTLPQSIYMSLSVTHAQDYARSNYARLHNYLKLHLAELEPGSLCVGLQGTWQNAEPLLEAARMAAGYNLIVIDDDLEVPS